jgi:hypothetical protein
MTTEPTRDREIASLLSRREPPPPRPGFWAALEAQIGGTPMTTPLDTEQLNQATDALPTTGPGGTDSGEPGAPTIPLRAQRPPERRWTVALLAAAAVIAVVVGGLFALQSSRDQQPAPATIPSPTVAPTTVPVTTSPAAAVSSTVPETVPSVAPVPTTAASTMPAPEQVTSADLEALPDGITGPVVAAGQAGVSVRTADGIVRAVTTEPAAIALGTDSGDVLFQRQISSVESEEASADTTVYRWDAATDSIAPVEVTNPTGGPVMLFDVEAVQGVDTILYTTDPIDCNAGNTCDAALMVQELDSGVAREIDRFNTFEGGLSGLTLAENGWIIGTARAEVVVSVYTQSAIEGVEAPTAESLGVQEAFVDCSTCPFAYSIDPTAQKLSWLILNDDGSSAAVQSTLGESAGQVVFDAPINRMCRLDADALQVSDKVWSGYVLVQPCVGNAETAPVAVELNGENVGTTTPLPIGTYYDFM